MLSWNLLGASLLALVAVVMADTVLTVTNNCDDTIWPVMDSLDGTGPMQGWEASAKTSMDIPVAGNYVGNIWARQGCRTLPSGGFSCATGHCGGALNCTSIPDGTFPNITIVQFSLNGKPNNHYDINISGGFNLPVELTTDLCPSVSCLANFTASCPKELHGASDSNGDLLSCLSSCTAQIGTPDQQHINCGGGTVNSIDIDYYNWFNSGCADGIKQTVPVCNKNPTKYTITYCPLDTVNIAAPAGEFASATTFAGSITASLAANSPSQTPSTTTDPSSALSTAKKPNGNGNGNGNGQGAKAHSGPSKAAIAGIVIGVLAWLAFLGLGAFVLCRRRRARRRATDIDHVPLEEYVRPYEVGLTPARPLPEKQAPRTESALSKFPVAGSSSGSRTETNAEFEERFEERFQTRLMHFLQTQMDAPVAPGAPKEALPGYPGLQTSHALLRRNSGSDDDIKTSVGS